MRFCVRVPTDPLHAHTTEQQLRGWGMQVCGTDGDSTIVAVEATGTEDARDKLAALLRESNQEAVAWLVLPCDD